MNIKRFLPLFILLGAAVGPLGAKTADGAFKGNYYGVNYTVPFAHAYRALDRLGVDRKEAIDRDVYHFARLGLNAYRLHLWDVEISDAQGNLLDNDHLDLLDYLIARLEERGIDIVLTAQTNFGNGYPEANTDPNGAFSYDFEKCAIHDLPEAQAIQQNYLRQLVDHRNRYTGKTLKDDPSVLAIEINNEPCHSGSAEDITAYINLMIDALRDGGWQKPVFYNVSHNTDRATGYYNAPIDGATFQWYPTGLVANHRRKGNFLPLVDAYDIPLDTIPGFEAVPKIVYEFDPADNIATYLYPAVVRTLRGKGFQWITQFAYDPIDMAAYNTEYQTHYLNLAYTPGKAVGMMIAAEAMRQLPEGRTYGKYPVDTVFGNFTVSASRDLALLNDGPNYLHTNNSDVAPLNPRKLRRVAGVGSSPLVSYDGSGAYFLDRLDNSTWRLEVMPDVVIVHDPFTTPTLDRKAVQTVANSRNLALTLPGLSDSVYVASPAAPEALRRLATRFEVEPGVYIISAERAKAARYASNPDMTYGDRALKIGEYVAPREAAGTPVVVHHPQLTALPGDSILVTATAFNLPEGSRLRIYPAEVSMWRNDNTLYDMTPVGPMDYAAAIPVQPHSTRYSIVLETPDGGSMTWPGALDGNPLVWDFSPEATPLSVATVNPNEPVVLVEASSTPDMEISTVPGSWRSVRFVPERDRLSATDRLRLTYDDPAPEIDKIILTKYVGDIIADRKPLGFNTLHLAAESANPAARVTLALVNADGFTYGITGTLDDLRAVDLADLSLMPTPLVPEPFPVFLSREFVPDPAHVTPLAPDNIEHALIIVEPDGSPVDISIKSISISKD